ncbi:DNA recombination protein RecN [Helicobacter sp. 12S02634-8]|uniref:AAA family ATPase n=1 Tax=Helicobacter sp. 12S02634-8 TaxID=1476199 RepID=UPI000BA4E7E2|nr:AAA family ATPase [Helicobacter sp. 12S02634-8]PAF47578.1 DNA recombination protein RecN [Helicobacter sp. 12S02634-8]
MILRLLIKDSVAFSDVDLEFQNGFNVFSGASGSGKSVLMESLLALFGLKESNAALIEADLEIALQKFGIDLEAFGLQSEGEDLVLSIIKKDKTRYFINRSASPKKRLIDLVSPFGKHIASKGAHELEGKNVLRILDSLVSSKIPSHQELLESFKMQYHQLLALQAEQSELEEQEKNIQNLKEFAAFEIQKIASIQPSEGEYEHLLELKKTLSKKEKIHQSIQEAMEVLDRIPKIYEALNSIDKEYSAFEESVMEVQGILEDENTRLLELSELDAGAILDRISVLSDLNRRYGSIAQALSHLQDQKQKLKDYEELSFNKDRLQAQIQQSQQICAELCTQIKAHRSQYVGVFQKEIAALCAQLLLKAPHIGLKDSPMGKNGTEMIAIKLENTAIESLSSGEYNRLRLAMMCLDAQINASSGILVLDEIDANLSGEESEGVAKVLQMLSKTYQIFAISHQPHMPALADRHYLVFKQEGKSQVKLLDKEGRILEMARMISGASITQEALDFAKKKLEQNGLKDSR